MFLAAILAFQAVPATDSVTCPGGSVVRGDAYCPGLVFFDSGEAEIRREWHSVLDAAAAEARSGGRLTVTGHSDTPGSAAVNHRMARKRAEAVAMALIARGVPTSSITVEAAGESEPLVPTDEGVREIHNRRVAITFTR